MAINNPKKPAIANWAEVTCFLYLLFVHTSECYPRVASFLGSDQIAGDELDPPADLHSNGVNVLRITTNYWPKFSRYEEIAQENLETTTIEADSLSTELNAITLTAKMDTSLPEADILHALCSALSRIIHIPVEDMKVVKFEKESGNIAEIHFVYSLKGGAELDMNPEELGYDSELSVERIQNETVVAEIVSVKVGEMPSTEAEPTEGQDFWYIFHEEKWKAWQLAVIIVCCLFAVFTVLVMVYFFSTCRAPKSTSSSTPEERQVVLHPVLKPEVSGVNAVQPENRDACITETDSEHTSSPCCSPMRMKGKGLLERRGSNASLTLDLNRSQENVHYGTPPKECSAEEYLMSAGHKLTRKQLRNCLKDVKSLHSEFWEIPLNHPEKVEVAGSGTKNRYKTILPNEASRVLLKSMGEDPLASYINANFIRGYGGEPRAYIATQGPLTHTVNDFWTMVWEQKCPIIVMITKLKEKLKVKCESYLPECVGHYSGIEVTVLREIPRDGYTIRELLLKKGQETHNVCHFWFSAWPDHRTPDTAKQLLAMALEVDALRHNGNKTVKGPTVVHCSAGIGRTGCFIAISTGIRQLMEEDLVDVLGIVCGLRLDRGGMIQTAEQYEFVHQALCVFELSMGDASGE